MSANVEYMPVSCNIRVSSGEGMLDVISASTIVPKSRRHEWTADAGRPTIFCQSLPSLPLPSRGRVPCQSVLCPALPPRPPYSSPHMPLPTPSIATLPPASPAAGRPLPLLPFLSRPGALFLPRVQWRIWASMWTRRASRSDFPHAMPTCAQAGRDVHRCARLWIVRSHLALVRCRDAELYNPSADYGAVRRASLDPPRIPHARAVSTAQAWHYLGAYPKDKLYLKLLVRVFLGRMCGMFSKCT
jgi:hypothetical protein